MKSSLLMALLSGRRIRVTRAWEYWLAAVTVSITTVAALYVLWQIFFGASLHLLDFILMIGFSLLTGVGISVGFHRLLTHKSFECGKTVKVMLTILASMAMQGPVYYWVTYHRKHHRYSDTPDDVHTPQTLGGLRGFWHAHFGWLFNHELANRRYYVTDLLQDRELRWLDRTYFLWVMVGILLPGLIDYAYFHTTTALYQGMIWGGLARIFILHHLTWSVNSFGHYFGRRDYQTHDQSRNVVWLAFIGQGEGWQNNHHAFPHSARLGLAWWQWDGYYYVIKLLERFGLVWNVIVPSAEALAAKRIKS